MATSGSPARADILRFGSFELNLARLTLSKGGVRLKLQRQPMQLLALLAQQAPEIVSRESIRQHIWGDGIYIDVEQNINFCIRQIRSVLLDNAIEPRYIQTVPREGYRFIASIEATSAEARPLSPVSLPAPTLAQNGLALESAPPKRPISRWRQMAVLLLAGISVVAGLLLWLRNREQLHTVLGISPVTTFTGDAREPSLSPDGRQIAFSWDGEGTRHIYVMLLGEQHPLRITQGAVEDGYPAWSPDGKSIAFIRKRTNASGDIMLTSPLGGGERILHSIQFGYGIESARRLLAWTPDAKSLCFASEPGPSAQHRLFLLSIETGAVRTLLANPGKDENDASPAFSPDGRYLTFARFSAPFNSRLFIQPLEAGFEPHGQPMPVLNTSDNPTTPVWLADSRTVLLLDDSGHRVMQAQWGKSARLVFVSSDELTGLSSTASGSRFVCTRLAEDRDIWSLPLNGLKTAGPPVPLIQSTADDLHPDFSPDGRSLAFRSNRTGQNELWLADANGQNPRQLTHLRSFIMGFPTWSADSRHLLFHARIPDVPQIFQIAVQTGALERITGREGPGFAAPSYSTGGENVFALQESKPVCIYRLSLKGQPPVRLCVGSRSQQVPGRNLLLYAKADEPGLFTRSLAGDVAANAETHLLDHEYVSTFRATSDGIYYVSSTPSGHPLAIRFYSFASSHSIDIAPAPANYSDDLALTPDRTRLAYSARVSWQNIVQLEIR